MAQEILVIPKDAASSDKWRHIPFVGSVHDDPLERTKYSEMDNREEISVHLTLCSQQELHLRNYELTAHSNARSNTPGTASRKMCRHSTPYLRPERRFDR